MRISAGCLKMLLLQWQNDCILYWFYLTVPIFRGCIAFCFVQESCGCPGWSIFDKCIRWCLISQWGLYSNWGVFDINSPVHSIKRTMARSSILGVHRISDRLEIGNKEEEQSGYVQSDSVSFPAWLAISEPLIHLLTSQSGSRSGRKKLDRKQLRRGRRRWQFGRRHLTSVSVLPLLRPFFHFSHSLWKRRATWVHRRLCWLHRDRQEKKEEEEVSQDPEGRR